jgi:galactose-1-phosphate uridylyltransferase
LIPLATSAHAERVGGGRRSPIYEEPYVFQNDFGALLPDTPLPASTSEIFRCGLQENRFSVRDSGIAT